MTEDAYAFVSGPTMVEEFTGIAVSTDELGGPTTHARQSGAASVVVADVAAAVEWVDALLQFVPDNVDNLPTFQPTGDDDNRPTPEAGELMPTTSTGSYDVRDVISSVVDDGYHFEVRPRWAGNVVTTFATIGEIGRAHV